MYIVEIIAKLIKKHRERPLPDNSEMEVDEKCEHVYLSIDSGNTHYACNKCGHVIKNPKLVEKKNIFKV